MTYDIPESSASAFIELDEQGISARRNLVILLAAGEGWSDSEVVDVREDMKMSKWVLSHCS